MNVDTRIKLLANLPIEIPGAGLAHSFTIKDICEIGYEKYSEIMNIFMYDVKQIKEFENEDINIFDIIVNIDGNELRETFEYACKKIFKINHCTLSTHYQCLFIEGILSVENGGIEKTKNINRHNFNNLKDFILISNGLSSFIETQSNPKDENAKRISEKIAKSKKVVDRLKSSESKINNIDISDIISAVTTRSHNINKTNFLDLSIYQLYDEYNRLNMIDNYEKTFQIMIHGASSKESKLELKHWSSKIEE